MSPAPGKGDAVPARRRSSPRALRFKVAFLALVIFAVGLSLLPKAHASESALLLHVPPAAAPYAASPAVIERLTVVVCDGRDQGPANPDLADIHVSPVNRRPTSYDLRVCRDCRDRCSQFESTGN
jgi:hypothetical protein